MVARCLERRGTSKMLPYGPGEDIAREFGVSRTTVFRYLKAEDLQVADGQPMDISRGRRGRCVRPNAVPSISRTVNSGIPLSSLWRLCRRVGARKHKWLVKQVLSDKQRRDRVDFALSNMHRKGGSEVVVDDMYDWVHVDEKWFYVMNDGRGITCTQKRTPPSRQGPRTSDSSRRSVLQLKEDVGVFFPEDLVEATTEAFGVKPRETLERVWQSLFAVLG
ncbi:unnamed protein product [Discosporangium mesarthrocarpum]